MRIRSRLVSRVPLDMTPLIDIVFQLLIFFALTLRLAEPEGEFEMRMPLCIAHDAATRETPPLIVILASSDSGALESVSLNDQPQADIKQLHERVAALVGGSPHLATDARVELRCDQRLAYEHALAALAAVSARRQPDGTLVRLIHQVSLAPAQP